VGLLGVGSVVEVALITMQRWREVPSHFNHATVLDSAVFGAMGLSVALVVVATVVLFGWSAVQARGHAGARIAAVVGLFGVLAAGVIGKDMIDAGEEVVAATGQVPSELVFGAAGSAKLAHAVGLHGFQLLILLTIGLALGAYSASTRRRLVALGAAGWSAVFAAVVATAYAGRVWTEPMPAVAALGATGLVAIAVAAVVTVTGLRRRPSVGRNPARASGHGARAVVS
jgi:hypothetical protein